MSEHICPIEPYDWNNGDGNTADFDSVVDLCPVCKKPADDQGDGTWKCAVCDWIGTEPVFQEIERSEDDYL